MIIFLNEAVIASKTVRQTTASLNSTEAGVKAIASGVEVVHSLTGLWNEFLHQRHGGVRVLDDSAAAIAQVNHGMESQKCAS